MNIEELERMVIKWAEDRNLFKESNLFAQLEKLEEEFNELHDAIHTENNHLAIDAIGDMMVVMTMIAKFYGVNLFTCYATAYVAIKDRKGKMVNGVFVKEQ